ncbi:MAG: solute carrier family 23 protein, partial [Mixta calida]|nr:solute carrier family 23 protein [Mixta calida]
MRFIDTHCHFDFPPFTDREAESLAQAAQAGVERIIVPAIDATRFARVLQLSRQHPPLYAALGLHPIVIDQHSDASLEQLERHLRQRPEKLVAIGEIIGTPVDEQRIARGLRADMLTSALSPLFNSFPQSAFAQNIGLVAMTGIKSRFVVAAGGAILILLGLLPVLGRVIAAIPMPVLGGAGVVLFGTVAASGIRTLAKVDYKDNMNLVIVATALAFGII